MPFPREPANPLSLLDPPPPHGAAARPEARAGQCGTRPGLTCETLPVARGGAPGPDPEPAGPDSSRFAGHHLVKCVGRGPLGEMWQVRAPDGRTRCLQFPTGLTDGCDPAEAEAVRFLTGR